MKELIKNPGVQFIIKFVGIFLVLYLGTIFWEGVCAPGGTLYSPFLETHLNYIAWMRSSILHGGNIAGHLMGLSTVVVEPYLLTIPGGPSVQMVYSCIGIGIMSFWAAFALALTLPLTKKLIWTFGGLFIIWFINCWRIAFLLLALKNDGNINRFGEHHTVFNIACYIVVFGMMYGITYKKKNKFVEQAV